MLRDWFRASVLVLILAQLSLAQFSSEDLKKAVRPAARSEPAPVPSPATAVGEYPRAVQGAAAAPKMMRERLLAPEPGPCVALDVLIGCVVFDAKGQLRLTKEGTEPEVNRAGTIGPNLAAKLNEDRGKLPPAISPGTAGADFLLENLADAKRLQSLSQLQILMSIGGKEAFAQMGHRQPRVTGVTTTSASGRPARTNTVVLENVGTLVRGSAQQDGKGKIGLALSVERSTLGPEEEGEVIGTVDGKDIRTPTSDTLTVESQITAADGQSVLLGDFIESWQGGVKETFVIVTPTIVK